MTYSQDYCPELLLDKMKHLQTNQNQQSNSVVV